MQKNTRKNLISAGITLLILCLGIFVFKSFSAQKTSTIGTEIPPEPRRTVSVQSFQASQLPNNIPIDGRLKAYESVTLSTKVNGLLLPTANEVRPGKFYEKGTPLFIIDSEEVALTIKAQKSALIQTITMMMPDIHFDYPDAKPHWDRYMDQFDINKPLANLPEPLSEQERNFIHSKNLHGQFFNIKSLETRLRDYTIRAPFNGTVTAVNYFPGALVNPGAALATLINSTLYELEAPVPYGALQYIQSGQSVNLRNDEGASWKGKVIRVGTQIDPVTQYVPVYIQVAGKDLKDGMYVSGTLQGGSMEDVASLPKSVFVNPGKIYTVVDSTLTITEVTQVKREDNTVLVKNLSPEALVVTSSQAGLYEGQKVNY